MSKVPVPGLQYPAEIDHAKWQDRAISMIIDNLYYLRGVSSGAPTTTIPSRTQIQSVVKELISTSSTTTGTIIQIGTHAQRLALTSIPAVGTPFIETDRTSIYVVSDSTGIAQWTWFAGSMVDTTANIPTDLGTADKGFLFSNSDTDINTEYVWSGTEWWTVGGYLQEIADAATNAITTVQVLRHITSGAATTAFGLGTVTQIEDSAGTAQTSSYETVEWTTAGTDTILKRWWLRIAAVLTQIMELASTGLTLLVGDYIWRSGTSFTGTLAHNNSANRTWNFPDETGDVVYETTDLDTDQIVLGANAGSRVKELGSLGTTTTVLHGNAAGAPTFAAVSLTADVSDTLPVGNGGTGGSGPVAFASLPTGVEGMQITITDSNTAVWGAVIAGGGANRVLGYYNGANWTVAAI